MLLNPFFLYSVSWLGMFSLYNLKISSLYPKLSNELLNFIFLSTFIAFGLGIFYNNKFKENKILNKIVKKYMYIYGVIYLYFLIEFLYIGKVPLVETLLKTGYMYYDFKGIKTFHIIFITYNFYISLCTFNNFQSTKEKQYLFYSVLGIIPYILLYSRGSILLLCVCYFFIWLFYKYKLKTIIKTGILGIIILYLFGISGNIRHYQEWNDTKPIKKLASINTKENFLDPFIWSYVYITSPLGNLQYNFNHTIPVNDIRYFICENMFPDAINKRLNYSKITKKLMVESLTASTMYIEPYLSYGKIGMSIVFFIYMFCELMYLLIFRKTKYYIIAVTLISMLNIFTIFSNVFVKSGISFCLVYPLIDILIDKIKIKRR